MVVTLTCATCQRQETHAWDGEFVGWLQVIPIAPTAEGKPRLATVCSLCCLGWWGQHQRWRQHAELEAKRAQEANA